MALYLTFRRCIIVETKHCEVKGNIRKVVVLVDYENASESATLSGCILDLKQLIKECVERIGVVKVALVFAPLYLVTEEKIEEFDTAGFDCIACPKRTVYGKEKDRVDSRMISIAKKLFDEHSDVTDIVIVSNDGDFTPLVTFFKHRGKRVTLFGLGDISNTLKKVVDIIYPIPVKKI